MSRKSGALEIKVYVILQRLNVHAEGAPNTKVLATRLNLRSAQAVVDENPGTWMERHMAIK